jgi:phage/plasmid-like protein (TIGR03299 family)
MSQETSKWLNTMTLIGYTKKRGEAWHYRASDQGAEPNHYPGEIPVADIQRRLFYWKPVEGSLESTILLPGVEEPVRLIDTSRKTIVHPDTKEILGIFKLGFRIHDYQTWLVELSQDVMGSGIGAASAGLLKGGAVAWVQYEMDETMDTPEGVEYRPFFLAASSLDGSLSSTWQRGVQLVVCDNTLSGSLRDNRRLVVKTRHSKNSVSIPDVRERLEIITKTADTFEQEVKELCGTKVSNKKWQEFLDAHLGERPERTGKGSSKQGFYDTHRDALLRLWNRDPRVSPWKGTAFGVLQAVNTYAHHEAIIHNRSRAESNAQKMVYGAFDKLGNEVYAQLKQVGVLN